MVLFRTELTKTVAARDLAFLLGLYIAGLLLIPRDLFLEILNGVMFSVCTAVMVLYGANLRQWSRTLNTGLVVISVGIIGSWWIDALVGLTRIYLFELYPEVTGRTFDVLGGLPVFGKILFASLHIIAMGMIKRQLSRKHVLLTAWTMIAGVIGTLALSAGHWALS